MKNYSLLLCFAGLAALAPTGDAQTVSVLPFATPRALSRDGIAATGWMGSAPFLWKQSTGLVAIPGSLYNPRTVSDAGAIVAGLVTHPGTTFTSTGYWTAATGLWVSIGSYPGIGGCPGYGEPYAVSADGSMLAGEVFLNCDRHPYTWTHSGGYVLLPITGNAGHVSTLSGDGQLVGGWDTHPTLGFRRAALWDSSTVETFPLISKQNPTGAGEITAMNNDGSIYAGQNNVLGAFVKRGDVFTPIAVPNNNSIPTGVSDDGMVVVGSWGSPFTGKTPWVWTESGGAQEANEFFFGQGVSIPEYMTLTEMFGVSRDGLTFLAKYDGSGPKPGGAIVITLPGAQDAWTDQGNALAGVTGDPLLVGTGTLVQGSLNSADLSNAALSAPAGLFIALSSAPVPFKGGTLMPVPFLPPVLLTTSAFGAINIPFTMPPGIPAGTELWVQWGIQDAAAVQGVALSNAILGTTP